jgi:AraC-like DNA-binding protein
LNERAVTSPPERNIAGIGRVCFWNGGSAWVGRQAGRVERHAHHAVQLTLVFDGTVSFRIASEPWREVPAAIVAPDRLHEFDGQGRTVAQVFIEPESVVGRALAARAAQVIAPLDSKIRDRALGKLRAAYETNAPDEAIVAGAREAIALVGGTQPQAPVIDARVRAALDRIQASPGAAFTLAEVAAACALSPGRFRHLFVEQVGISFRAYVLWTRINHAIDLGMHGSSWTDAAHEAGFADSAHLTRTFRRMFGVAPRMLVPEARGEVPAAT